MDEIAPQKRRHRSIWTAMVLLAALLPGASLPPPQIERAPGFILTLYGGGQVRSDELRGKLVVLNFWATWCAPCQRELAEIDAIAARHGAASVAAFAIDAERSPDPRQLAKRAAMMTLPIVTAIAGPYYPRNGIVPTTYVIDRRGQLVLVKSGAFKPGELNGLLTRLLL